MNLNYPALKLLYISILIVNIKSYIVIPLKSTMIYIFLNYQKMTFPLMTKKLLMKYFINLYIIYYTQI